VRGLKLADHIIQRRKHPVAISGSALPQLTWATLETLRREYTLKWYWLITSAYCRNLNSTEIPPTRQNVALTRLLDEPTLCGVAIADLGDLPAQGRGAVSGCTFAFGRQRRSQSSTDERTALSHLHNNRFWE
jgi:hypothetical protein